MPIAKSCERLAANDGRGTKRFVDVRQCCWLIPAEEGREAEKIGHVRQFVFLAGLQDGRPKCEQRGLRLVDASEEQIDRCGELQRAELDRGLTARVLEFERAAEGIAVEPVVLDELDVGAKGDGICERRLITRRRGELLGPAGVWQGAREVGHRQQREAEICLELRHAAGFGTRLPDRVLQTIDGRREALAECDLGDQAVRPRADRWISRRGEDLFGKCGRPDDVAGALVMLGGRRRRASSSSKSSGGVRAAARSSSSAANSGAPFRRVRSAAS